MFHDSPEESLNEMLNELEDFVNISGLKINCMRHKLYGLAFKIDTASIKTKLELLWGKQAFKLLGINCNTDLTQLNRTELYTQKRALDNMTKNGKRNLTPLVKITAIHVLSYLLSITYLLSLYPAQNKK